MENQKLIYAPSDGFADNLLSKYRVQLPEQLILDETWSVGLVEIICPIAVHNVVEGENAIFLKPQSVPVTIVIEIPPGRYFSIEGLIQTINDQIGVNDLVSSADISFRFDSVVSRVVAQSATATTFYMGSRMASILGFEAEVSYRAAEMKAELAPQLYAGTSLLFIYADFIKSQTVGNTQAPLLRVAAFQEPYTSQQQISGSSMRTIAFEKIIYIPCIPLNTNENLIHNKSVALPRCLELGSKAFFNRSEGFRGIIRNFGQVK